MSAAVAVIQFLLDLGDGTELDFLRLWNEGEFDKCRKEWPEAPEACYIGADPLHPLTFNEAAYRPLADKAFPNPKSPHGSVTERWISERLAFKKGYCAALGLKP